MTISNQDARTGPYNGNGATTSFSYDFKVIDEDHLVVRVRSSVGERPGHHLGGTVVTADGVHGDPHGGLARDSGDRIRHGGQPDVATGSLRPWCRRPA